MFRENYARKVTNRRIGSKFHQILFTVNYGFVDISQYWVILQIYTLEQEKRGLCPYNDKRYLLADLPDAAPNLNTHVYGHHELSTEVRVLIDMLEQSGTELVLEQQQPTHNTDSNESPYHTSLQVVKRELQFGLQFGLQSRLLSEIDAILRAKKSNTISTTWCLIKMKTVSLSPPDFAKQNEPLHPVQKQLLGSKMLSSKSAPVTISVYLTHRRNKFHRQFRNKQVIAITDWCLISYFFLFVINSHVRADRICRAMAHDSAVSSTLLTKKTIYCLVHCRSANVCRKLTTAIPIITDIKHCETNIE